MQSEHQYRDPDWLERELYEKGREAKDVAQQFGITESAIHYWVDKHDLARRSSSVPEDAEETYRNPEWHREMHWDRSLTRKEMAERAGVKESTIINWASRLGVPTRYGSTGPAKFRTRESTGHETWRSMRHVSDARVAVHQLLAISEGADPRKIFSNGQYHVHHRNGIPWDNRPANIEVLSREEHARRHFKPYEVDGIE